MEAPETVKSEPYSTAKLKSAVPVPIGIGLKAHVKSIITAIEMMVKYNSGCQPSNAQNIKNGSE